MKVDFFEQEGGAAIWVEYSGPDTGGADTLLRAVHAEGSTDEEQGNEVPGGEKVPPPPFPSLTHSASPHLSLSAFP